MYGSNNNFVGIYEVIRNLPYSSLSALSYTRAYGIAYLNLQHLRISSKVRYFNLVQLSLVDRYEPDLDQSLKEAKF